MKLRWSDPAIAQLDHIRRYIARANPAAAERVAGRIQAAAGRLVQFPQLGPAVADGSREFVIPSTRYILQYELTEDEVRILGVWHGAQDRRGGPR